MRSICISQWGSDLGQECLRLLSQLYISIVWESTVLLALCSEEVISAEHPFCQAELERLMTKEDKIKFDFELAEAHARMEAKMEQETQLKRSTGEMSSNGVSQAMQSLSTSDSPSCTPMDTSEFTKPVAGRTFLKMSPLRQAQVKHIKPLLSASSRLGRNLAEVFGLLVKLCVGSPVRHRRIQQIQPSPTMPSEHAQKVASQLVTLLRDGLTWSPPSYTPVAKLR
jgi:E3 ubiquitin-protein ligase HUWE1